MADQAVKKEQLYGCPICEQHGFTLRGLKAHYCRSKKNRAQLTREELDRATNATEVRRDTEVTGWSRPSNSRKSHYCFMGVSLCKRFRFVGPMQGEIYEKGPFDKFNSENCAACKKQLYPR